MTSNRIFTKQIMGLDYRVWRVMLILSILSLGLLSYRLLDSKKCIPENFSIKTIVTHTGNTYNAGETLSFISSANKDEITWDFGDNTEKASGQYVTHTYQNSGSYKITASTGAGASCETVQSIQVIQAVVSPEANNNMVTGEEIVGPVLTLTGKYFQFACEGRYRANNFFAGNHIII